MFLNLAHGINPPSPNQVLTAPVSAPSTGFTLLNLSSADTGVPSVNAVNRNTFCDPGLGQNLNKTSCVEVWMKIPTDTESLHFGARTIGTFQRPLPLRYLSGKFNALTRCHIHSS